MSTSYFSQFHPSGTGAKGSAAFSSSATNSATIYLYRRSATDLTILDVPDADVIYTFLTAGIDLSLVSNNWSTTIPTGEEPLYIVSVYVASNETTVTIESTEWTAPALLSSLGLSTATVFLFQRNNTGVAPSAITQDTTYTFATGVLTGTYTPWTQTIPDSSEGRFLFITTALAIGEGDTATVLTASWTAPRLFSVEGVSPAVINLSNDSITVPAEQDGSSPNLTSASTIISIFEAGEDVTSLWSISATPSTGVTGSFTGNTYTITGFTTDTGTVTFTATRTGYVNLSSVLSLAKAKAGADGTPATVYELRVSPLVTRRNSSNVYLNNITVSGFSTTGNDAPVVYSGRFTVATSADSVNYTVQYTSTINQSSYEFNKTGLPAGTNFIRVRLHLADETPSSLNVLDEEITPVVDDGEAGPNTAVVYIYQRSATAPAAPSVNATYTFTSGVTTGLNNGWSSTIPTSGTDPIWVRTAVAFSSTTTDTIEPNEWSGASKLAENGLDGLNVAAVFIYQRSNGVAVIDSASLVQNFSVAGQETIPTGIFLKPDGTKLYIIGTNADTVFEYNLSTPWDISTASLFQSFSVSGQETTPHGISFSSDGTRMFIVGQTGDDVNQYALSTPWSVASASFTKIFSVATQETSPTDIFFSPDGTNMYICGTAGDDVNQYTLSTPWDVGTASFIRNFSFVPQDSTPTSIFFSSDGTKMYMMGSLTDSIYSYTLSTAWNISTAVYDSKFFSVATQDGTPSGLFIAGTKLYIVGSATDAVYEYNVSVYPSLPTADVTYNFSTGALTGLTNGWTGTIPDITAQPLWVSQASASSSGTTDVIPASEWTLPRILAQNGEAGEAGPPGTAGINGYLTNEAATVFAYANGIVASYTGATGNFVITVGDTDISTNFTLSTVANPENLTVTYTNLTYTVTGGLDANENTASLTIRATGSGDWAGVTLDKVFTLAKTRGGYEILSSLPAIGDPRRFEGSVVFLTIDDKLYRFDGTNWVASVPTTDLTGQIIGTQITDSAITTPKLSTNAVTADKIEAGAIIAGKIAANAIVALNIQAGTITASKFLTDEGVDLAQAQVPGTSSWVTLLTSTELVSTPLTAGSSITSSIIGPSGTVKTSEFHHWRADMSVTIKNNGGGSATTFESTYNAKMQLYYRIGLGSWTVLGGERTLALGANRSVGLSNTHNLVTGTVDLAQFGGINDQVFEFTSDNVSFGYTVKIEKGSFNDHEMQATAHSVRFLSLMVK
jgi:hypothetical protein